MKLRIKPEIAYLTYLTYPVRVKREITWKCVDGNGYAGFGSTPTKAYNSYVKLFGYGIVTLPLAKD